MRMAQMYAVRLGPAAALALLLVVLGGCSDPKRRPIGSTCVDSAECESGLCFAGQCVDPSGDADTDGLTNGTEDMLGSDGGLKDTDEDEILDPDELGPGLELVDTDGDGKPDIIESAKKDGDGDCITDQFDADDATPNTDLSPMIGVVCPTVGVCADQRDKLRAACPDGDNAVCIFGDVVGYAEPEALCDGRDDNCDGRVDEAFPGGCARPPSAFVAPDSGGRTVATSRYRATLVMGQPALDQTRTTRHRALIGSNPVLAPHAPLPTPEAP